jgi:hypothetical protein
MIYETAGDRVPHPSRCCRKSGVFLTNGRILWNLPEKWYDIMEIEKIH